MNNLLIETAVFGSVKKTVNDKTGKSLANQRCEIKMRLAGSGNVRIG